MALVVGIEFLALVLYTADAWPGAWLWLPVIIFAGLATFVLALWLGGAVHLSLDP